MHLAVPMSHVTGVIAMIDTMVYCAGTLIIMPAFKAADFIDLAARHRMTFSLIVPAMFNLCLLAPNFDGPICRPGASPATAARSCRKSRWSVSPRSCPVSS